MPPETMQCLNDGVNMWLTLWNSFDGSDLNVRLLSYWDFMFGLFLHQRYCLGL